MHRPNSIPYSGGSSNSWFLLFIFLFWSSKLFQLYHHGDSSKSSQGFACVFNFSFRSDHPFITGVLHGGSTWWFIKDFIPSRSFHRDSSLRSSSFFFILLSGVQFFLPYHWRWYSVILDNLSSCFMIHMLLRMRYFKSINLVIGVTLGYISPKAFPKDSCYLWCL